jgi:hypothetical protein
MRNIVMRLMEEWFGHDNGQYINVVMLMATFLVLYHMYFPKQACNVSCMRFNVSATVHRQ